MKTEEDEAFDDLARKQGAWGGGFKAKQAMAADKLQEPVVQPAPGYCKNCKDYTIEEPLYAQPAQEPEREALKLALEALELHLTHHEHGCVYLDPAITAIKAALAQPAQESYDQTALELCNVCGWKTLIPDDGCLNCERAQPTQEPVGEIRASSYGNYPVVAWVNGYVAKIGDKFYTTPPQREWVGLTDEEKADLVHELFAPCSKEASAALYLLTAHYNKLKEKNTCQQ